MPKLLSNILFYCLNGELGESKKATPKWLTEKMERLETLIGMSQMTLYDNDNYTDAIIELMTASELWGFIHGIQLEERIHKELTDFQITLD